MVVGRPAPLEQVDPYWLGHLDDLSGWRRILRKCWADHSRQKCDCYKTRPPDFIFHVAFTPQAPKIEPGSICPGRAESTSGKRDGEQARAKQDKTGNGH